MKKLIGMTDKFLNQPLELWMFIPCDLIIGKIVILIEGDEHYQQAKERCLFEGFELSVCKEAILDNNNTIRMHKGNTFSLNGKQVSIIKDLVKYNLTLTQTAQKQIGL